MIRVRFAPSPTGYLHVGGARTALYNYLYAKKHNEKFILRIEDTDLERSTEDALRMQVQDLAWLGLKWDEGVDPKTLKPFGEYGPYKQSERKAIYREHVDRLLEKGLAYYDFRTEEELEVAKQKAIAEGGAHRVPRPDHVLSRAEAEAKIKAGEPAAVRFKVDELDKEYVLNDLVRGEVKFPAEMVGDFVILRSNGMPVYNFCCVIDDALMKITHVLRAEEHLSNTLRQKMLYEAFGYKTPEFGHLSVILGTDRQKLSKRHGATSCNEYRERGYLPDAMLNYLALLGWSHPEGKEIITREELIQSFSLDRLNSAGAVFDEAKLKWTNAQHLRALPNSELWKLLEPIFASENFKLPESETWRSQALDVFKTSMEVLNDALNLFRPIDDTKFVISEKANETLAMPTTRAALESWVKQLKSHAGDFITTADFLKYQDAVSSEAQVKGKGLFTPIRVAVIGEPQGAELKILAPLIPKKSLIERAEKVIAKL